MLFIYVLLTFGPLLIFTENMAVLKIYDHMIE